MARLFIKHEPVDADVVRVITSGYLDAFRVLRSHVKGIECQYICFVENGVCFAAHSMDRTNANQLIVFYCKPMKDQTCVQQMLLADMILS